MVAATSSHFVVANQTGSGRQPRRIGRGPPPPKRSTEIPPGPPFHCPAPKSAFTDRPAPILATYSALRACTGSRDTSACHTSLTGKLGQPPNKPPGTGRAGALDAMLERV